MKKGYWIPISKGFLKALPHDRAYTELEAAYSLQIDFDKNQDVTVTGYCNLWRWSKSKVYSFLDRMNVKISYPEDTAKKRNQNGQITVNTADLRQSNKSLKTDLKQSNNGLIRLIDNNSLEEEKDLKQSNKSLKTDLKRVTTIKTKIKEPKIKEKKSIKEKYLEFVFLTKNEYEKLLNKLGKNELQDFIKRLNNYIGSSGKKYESHYYTILSWDRTDKKKQGELNNGIKPKQIDLSSLPGRDE